MNRLLMCAATGLFGLLVGGTEVVACDTGSPAPDAYSNQDAYYTRRYLYVTNATDEKLTMWVRYLTETTSGQWKWFDAEFDLAPRQESYLVDGGFTINASRVRIWGQTAGGDQLDKYKEKDLWLVPEVHANGKHCYSSSETKTFSFTFGD